MAHSSRHSVCAAAWPWRAQRTPLPYVSLDGDAGGDDGDNGGDGGGDASEIDQGVKDAITDMNNAVDQAKSTYQQALTRFEETFENSQRTEADKEEKLAQDLQAKTEENTKVAQQVEAFQRLEAVQLRGWCQ